MSKVDSDTVLNVILNVLTLATAVAAWVSAHQAKRAVRETHRDTQAQLVASLLDAYASEEMLDACVELERWRSKEGARFAEKFRKLRIEDYDNIRQLDRARRRVSHYFQKVCTLYTSGLLDETLVRIAASRQQVMFYREVLEPLEAAVSPEYDSSSFDTLGQLYGVTRQPDRTPHPWHMQ